MSRRTIIVVILLAVLSLGIIIAGQVYWVRNAYSIQEKQFNDRVVIALNAVVDEILVMNKDSALTEPVEQKQSNFFVANINETPEPFLLETLLREEFERSNLREDFEYGIYDCFTDSIAYGGRVNFSRPGQREQSEQIQYLINLEPDGHYFGVYFPNKTTIILKQLDFWMYSSIVILLIVVFFSYTIFVILRQKRLSEVKTDFINNMTHELKTPISTIAVSVDNLEKPGTPFDPERVHRYLGIIRSENDRLSQQVEKVLQIATLSPRSVQLKLERVDLHEILHAAAASFRMKLEEEGGELSMDLQAAHHFIRADRVHITNVVHNLLDNAVKYTERTPMIHVSTRNEGSTVMVSIRDNGIGISPVQQKLIFDKFYRVPTGNRHDVKGFGLGLFYVKTIIRAHRGNVAVESRAGEGSTFTITLTTTD